MNDSINDRPTAAVEDTILQKRVPTLRGQDGSAEYRWIDYSRASRLEVQTFVAVNEAGIWRGVDWITAEVVIEPRRQRITEAAALEAEVDLTPHHPGTRNYGDHTGHNVVETDGVATLATHWCMDCDSPAPAPVQNSESDDRPWIVMSTELLSLYLNGYFAPRETRETTNGVEFR